MSRDEPRWFHVVVTAYGAWLPGDLRGFRTRHHRQHVAGDYKNPPPEGLYDELLARSKGLLKQEPVRLTPLWRGIVGAALRDRLGGLGAEVIAVAMSATHAHYLAKMSPLVPRAWTGHAKRHAWFVARAFGWGGHLWGKRSRATPVKDRGHQVQAFNYIVRHAAQGAWVWTFRDPPTSPSNPERAPPPSPPVATGGL